MTKLFTIGTDMELFARHKDGHHVAMCGKVGGTKEHPMQIKGWAKGFCLQEDNVCVEFNVPPAQTRSGFISNVTEMRSYTEDMLNKKGLEMSQLSSASFSHSELTHPLAQVFGCEPDFNAWKKIENGKPLADDKNLRTCGGHIHCGTDKNFIDGTQLMDAYLGVSSVILDNTPESRRRRKLYGAAGAMRPKPYGFEYRVLSNFWLFDDSLIKWAYDNTRIACNSTQKITIKLAKDIQKCINTSDTTLAEKLIKSIGVSMP